MHRYDTSKSYRWNYEHAPDPAKVPACETPDRWSFCGLPVSSPLGIAAGPLLNGRWCLYYAARGFDSITYKTVRSASRECYPLPNLLPVDVQELQQPRPSVNATASMLGTWAVSFGMPSTDPKVWRRDVQWTRDQLPDGKILNVSGERPLEFLAQEVGYQGFDGSLEDAVPMVGTACKQP